MLPQILINGNKQIKLKSGIYFLTIKYINSNSSTCSGARQEAAVVIGEISFHSHGNIMAEGADWDRLLNGQHQTQLPYAHGARGQPTWLSRKISEPWEDGVELKFRIDSDENTIVYQKGNTPEKTFWNVLAFTNNRLYTEYMQLFAYCGGNGVDPSSDSNVKLCIVDVSNDRNEKESDA